MAQEAEVYHYHLHQEGVFEVHAAQTRPQNFPSQVRKEFLQADVGRNEVVHHFEAFLVHRDLLEERRETAGVVETEYELLGDCGLPSLQAGSRSNLSFEGVYSLLQASLFLD